MKTCTKCREELDDTQFYHNRRKCKTCYNGQRNYKRKNERQEELALENGFKSYYKYKIFNHLKKIKVNVDLLLKLAKL